MRDTTHLSAIRAVAPSGIFKSLAVASAVVAMLWPNAGQTAEPALAGSQWQLTSVGTTAMPSGGTLQFSNDQVTGRGPCNRFFATYRQFGARLGIDRLGSTKMMCPGQMEREKAFFDGLGNVASFRIDGSSLSLLDKSGGVVIRLSR